MDIRSRESDLKILVKRKGFGMGTWDGSLWMSCKETCLLLLQNFEFKEPGKPRRRKLVATVRSTFGSVGRYAGDGRGRSASSRFITYPS